MMFQIRNPAIFKAAKYGVIIFSIRATAHEYFVQRDADEPYGYSKGNIPTNNDGE